MIEALTVNAQSTIALFIAIMAMYPAKKLIHVFLDPRVIPAFARTGARGHATPDITMRLWCKNGWPGRIAALNFIPVFTGTCFVPAYCPHLNPIERLWGLMHKTVTHNKCYAKFNGFCGAMLTFLREDVPKNWASYRDTVTDNFRVISPDGFRVLT